ncbi:hypothetical protein [Tunturiibacter lichenicola]|jgi:hypothetical protein|uniref:hypothetical protein n=1 Tax=Tunturiibacter lichenicola TaxID=2051959 RepID=UPI003D9ABF67
MHFIGLDIHKKTISYCVKDVSATVLSEGTIAATRAQLSEWMKSLSAPWTVAMEATMFTSWIYDYLLPHAAAREGGASADAAGYCGGQEEERSHRCRRMRLRD